MAKARRSGRRADQTRVVPAFLPFSNSDYGLRLRAQEVFLDEGAVLGGDLIGAGQVELTLSETFKLTPEPVLEIV